MTSSNTGSTGSPAAPRRVVDVEDKEFWAAVDDGRFLIAQCSRCGAFYMRRQACLACGADGAAISWVPTPGLGTVRTFLVFDKVYHPYFASRIPYNVAVVRLDEGAELTTNVVDCPVDQVHIGMRVRVVVGERDGHRLPQASAELSTPRTP